MSEIKDVSDYGIECIKKSSTIPDSNYPTRYSIRTKDEQLSFTGNDLNVIDDRFTFDINNDLKVVDDNLHYNVSNELLVADENMTYDISGNLKTIDERLTVNSSGRQAK